MRKTVGVRGHYRKTPSGYVKVTRHSKNVVITPRVRRLFSEASRPHHKKEFGGVIDFEKKGNVERFTTEIGGSEREISLPDYEALWHTHPDKGPNPASPEDVVALLKNKNQQAEIVVNNGRIFTVIKTPKALKLSSQNDDALIRRFEKHFYKSAEKGPRQFYDSYAAALRKEGFIVKTYTDDSKRVVVPITVVD